MDIGIPQHLRDLGVKEADFPYMAEMALKDGNAFSNPRKGNEQEIAAIFRRILTVNEGPSCRFHRRVRLFYDPRGHHAGAINELCWGWRSRGPLPDHNL